MLKEKKALLMQYAEENKNKVFALKNWINLNVKPFSVLKALECIYDYAEGKHQLITSIIDQLTEKRNVYGRTQVYGNDDVKTIDIVQDGDSLVLKGYNPDKKLQLKGQHLPRSAGGSFTKDNVRRKDFAKAQERFYDIGSVIRELFPNESKVFISMAILAVRKYASDTKKSYKNVIDKLRSGKLVIDDDGVNVTVRPVSNESVSKGKVIILSEDVACQLREAVELTEYKFNNAVKAFLGQLLDDPVNAKLPFILSANGITKSNLIRTMISLKMLEKKNRIEDTDENGEPKEAVMMVKYSVPKKNFDRRLRNLFIRMVERNTKPDTELEECDAAGATTCGASSGPVEQPIFSMIRGKMPVSETATTDVGDYTYDVPFGDKNDESKKRHNGVGGSCCINYEE